MTNPQRSNVDRFLTAAEKLADAETEAEQAVTAYVESLGDILNAALPNQPGPFHEVAILDDEEDELDDRVLLVGREGLREVGRGMGGVGEPIDVADALRRFGVAAVVRGLLDAPAWLDHLAPQVESRAARVRGAATTLSQANGPTSEDDKVIRCRADIDSAVASVLADIANTDGLAWAAVRNAIGSSPLMEALGEISAWTAIYIEGVAATMHGHSDSPWDFASERFNEPCSYPEPFIAAVARTVTSRQATQADGLEAAI